MKRCLLYWGVCLIVLCCALGNTLLVKADMNPTIRVYLRRLKLEDSVRIQTKGIYMLSDGNMIFDDGTLLTVSLREGQLVLHTGSAAIRIGKEMRLIRCKSDMPCGLMLNDSGLYEGDLYLGIQEEALLPILSIHIEDYLLGVVPFEMGDSFPLEALKAQAIAARTYALRKSGSSGEYDVEDTTNDQAYRGRTTYSPLSERAVIETEGLCGTYQGRLAQCYYSASNGGQTELGQNVWPTSEPDAYGYMDMRDDPYDYSNEASVVKRFTLAKNTKKTGIGEALHAALVTALADSLNTLGFSGEANCVRIDEISNLELLSPKFAGETKLMTEMQFTLKLSIRDCLFRDSFPTTEDTHEHQNDATPSPKPNPTATPLYTEYQQLAQDFTVILPVFPVVEQAMGLSINTTQNELLTVTDIGTAFMIESRRYGHGVGMSQRGAEQMADKHGMDYRQILSFYYPGMSIQKADYKIDALPTPDMLLMATPAPTPSPTPRPTLMPVTSYEMEAGSYLAYVTNIEDNSTLNLREAPSLSSDVIRRLYKNQLLIVTDVSRDGWAKVHTDVIEGYVRAEYLQAATE